MDKKDIKKLLRETANVNEVKPTIKAKDADSAEKEAAEDKIANLLQNNDIINHAAIARSMTGQEWTDNTEATNRSKFRKKLNKLSSEEGSTYSFDDDEVAQIEKILMGISSKINNSIGRQGK